MRRTPKTLSTQKNPTEGLIENTITIHLTRLRDTPEHAVSTMRQGLRAPCPFPNHLTTNAPPFVWHIAGVAHSEFPAWLLTHLETISLSKLFAS
jgi:hypothetical protein